MDRSGRKPLDLNGKELDAPDDAWLIDWSPGSPLSIMQSSHQSSIPPTTHYDNKQDRILSEGPTRRFLYLRETKSWRCEEEEGGGGGEEKVSLKTHTTARARG